LLWRQNNPEVNYSPTRISGGSVSRGSIAQRVKRMKIGTWNVRSSYRVVSFKAAGRELGRYKLDVVGVQEVR